MIYFSVVNSSFPSDSDSGFYRSFLKSRQISLSCPSRRDQNHAHQNPTTKFSGPLQPKVLTTTEGNQKRNFISLPLVNITAAGPD